MGPGVGPGQVWETSCGPGHRRAEPATRSLLGSTTSRKERTLLVEFLAYLAELDRRKLYLELGSSTFAFLLDHLGYTGSAAFRRTTAARLAARFPVVLSYLGDAASA